jgi:hypothetical protein
MCGEFYVTVGGSQRNKYLIFGSYRHVPMLAHYTRLVELTHLALGKNTWRGKICCAAA